MDLWSGIVEFCLNLQHPTNSFHSVECITENKRIDPPFYFDTPTILDADIKKKNYNNFH